MDHHEKVVPLHILIFPLPLQAPVNCMLKLAELLSLAGIHVTFLNTHHIHHRLLKHTNLQSRFARHPEFRFETISDGLPEEHKRSGDRIDDIVKGIEGIMNLHFKQMLTSGRLSSKSGRPINCIIADGFFDFAVDIAKEVGIPLFYFETLSPCAIWVHFCLPKLIEAGEIPFKAELFSLSELRVTFLNTHHIHHRLLKHARVESRFGRYPEFRFQTISDGLPEDHQRSGDRFIEVINGIESVTKPLLKEMLASGCLSSKSGRPVTCIIADGFLSFVLDIAKEVGVPLLNFDTISPCALWTYLCIPKLIEVGEFPFKGNDLDAKITSVPGMENFLRRRDLPSFCRNSDLNDLIIQHVLKEDQELPRAQGVIVNTFEDLEEPILTHIRTICPNLYPIGPIHTLHKSILSANKSPPQVNSSNSLWEDDRSCMTWLDAQPPKSVIYVSIGSLAVMTRDQLMEFWHGLVNSGKRFLWVQRLGSVAREDDQKYEIPTEISDATKERGCIVSWVQQEEVLGHPSIGAFLTHSGWNSTLESIVEGVPMICWPYFVDQQVNSRFVGEVWRIGVDMKDSCDRGIIEKMIRDVMEVRKDEFQESANVVAKLARQSVCEGGSSYYSLDRLIKDIRKISLSTSQA